jgi:hypothetical protein
MFAAYTEVVRIGGASRFVNLSGDGVYRRVSLNKTEVDTVMQMVHPSASIDGILARFKAKNVKKTYDAYYCVPTPPPPPPAPPRNLDTAAPAKVHSPVVVVEPRVPDSTSADSPGVTAVSVGLHEAQASQGGNAKAIVVSEGGNAKAIVPNTIGWHSDPCAGALLQVFGTKQLQIGGIHVVPEGSASESVGISELPDDAIVKKVLLCENAIVGFGTRQIHCLNSSNDEENLSISIIIDKV